MADIDIQRKSTPIWPWILLGLILLALLLWFLLGRGTDDRVATGPVTDTVAPATETAPAAGMAGPAALQQFSQRCADPAAQQQAGMDHSFTVNCLRQLADAIEGTAEQQGLAMGAVQPQTQEVRDHAQQLEQSPPEAMDHANHVRAGAMAAVAAMQTLNQAPGTADAGGQVNQAEQTAQSIRPGVALLDQKAEVDRFFQQAYEALNRVAGTTTRM
jgi:hypothetical protein